MQGEIMENFDSKNFGTLKKICQDLRRSDDPSFRWEVTEQYLEVLIWIRTLLKFGVTVGFVFCLVWVYVQLQQSPAQNFLQACQQQETPKNCSDRLSGRVNP
jgi:hypothetical protein